MAATQALAALILSVLPNRDAVCGRPPLRTPRGPDLSSLHLVVEEPDHLIFVYELAVLEALVGAEFLDG
jgi:hypothetical protein